MKPNGEESYWRNAETIITFHHFITNGKTALPVCASGRKTAKTFSLFLYGYPRSKAQSPHQGDNGKGREKMGPGWLSERLAV